MTGVLERKCAGCQTTKPLEDFHKNARNPLGRQYSCKACHVEKNKNWARRNPETKKEYNKRQYLRDVARGGRPSKKVSNFQHRANNAVKRAIAKGTLTRPTHCSQCGDGHERIHAHHPDYTKPLLVVWVCPPCHGDIHAAERKSA